MRVYILRGISGSGKTTLAKRRCKMYPADVATTIISADDYMVGEDGKYAYAKTKLRTCHSRCFGHFLELLDRKEHQVLYVDNTNTRLMEVSPYVRLAEAKGVFFGDIRVVTVVCDPVVAWERSEHVADLHVILEQSKRLMEEGTPPFWSREIVASGSELGWE